MPRSLRSTPNGSPPSASARSRSPLEMAGSTRSSTPYSRRSPPVASSRRSASRFSSVAAPLDAHEWVSFEDPDEDRTWLVDVTFLSSRWRCIFGNGCQGVLTGPASEIEQGCCSYGAHFSDDADVARGAAAVDKRLPAGW